jgi:hypothetical protein
VTPPAEPGRRDLYLQNQIAWTGQLLPPHDFDGDEGLGVGEGLARVVAHVPRSGGRFQGQANEWKKSYTDTA